VSSQRQQALICIDELCGETVAAYQHSSLHISLRENKISSRKLITATASGFFQESAKLCEFN